ncbi:MAG: CCA tRNA nucleotidyltransferase [Candidatus Anstonellales archaeon]
MRLEKSLEKVREELRFALARKPAPSADSILQRIRSSTKRKAVLAGSLAKGTYLPDDIDADIFVYFDEKEPQEKMLPEIEAIAKKAFPEAKREKKFAKHPYLSLVLKGMKVELVPVYDVPIGKVKSAVDRSPFHTEYINSHLNDSQKDDVRILKKLLKAHLLYGAEIKYGGFSGYLAELLILHYKSLSNLIRQAAFWKRVFIDMENYHKGSNPFDSPFVVIDPVDRSRNVAAAVSEHNFYRFSLLARAFLKNPDLSFFSAQKADLSLLKAFYPVFITFKTDAVEDIYISQLNSLGKRIAKATGAFDYFAWDEPEPAILLFYTSSKLGGLSIRVGPEISSPEHSEAFSKGKKVFQLRSRLYALSFSKLERPEAVVKRFIKPLPNHLFRPKINAGWGKRFSKALQAYAICRSLHLGNKLVK